jgi:CubicO group peptidase (beta-lactamase class C family)
MKTFSIFRIFIFFVFFCAQVHAAEPRHFHNRPSLEKLFHQAIRDHAFPGGCIVVGSRNHIFVQRCYGYFTYDKKRRDTLNSEFDLASLTKVVATTSAIMKLYDQHKIKLDDRVVHYLPEFRGPTAHQTQLKSKITIKDLLTHSSGLAPDADVKTWRALYRVPLEARPHDRTIYSDINFLLLGKIVEKISGENLNQFTRNNIFKLLNMNHTKFKPKNKKNIIPTEYSLKKHRYLRGIPDDPMSRHWGGITGNAGLFSTAKDLSRFAQMMLNEGLTPQGRIFKASTIRLFTSRAHLVKNSTRTLGWDTAYLQPKPGQPKKIQHQFTAGLYIDAKAYGHSGYTGTSLWISPKNGIFVLLLTNRVYPNEHRHNFKAQRYWRQRLDSAAWEDLGFHKKNILYREKLN